MRVGSISMVLVILWCASLQAQPENRLSLQTKAAEQGTTGIQLLIELEHAIGGPGMAGFSFGLSHDVAALDLVDLEYFLDLVDPDFIQINAPAMGSPFPTIGVVFALSPPLEYLPIGSYTVARVSYDVLAGAPVGFSEVAFDDSIGSPAIDVIFTNSSGLDVTVDVIDNGGIIVLAPIPFGTIENVVWFPNSGDDTVSLVELPAVNVVTATGSPEIGPRAVAVGTNGIGWVCFEGMGATPGSVVRFTPDGNLLGNAIPVSPNPTSICIDASGDAWVTDAGAGTVSKISASGIVLFGDTGALGPAIAVGNGPQGIASDAIGNIWVAVSGDDQLKKLNNDGQLATVIDLLPGDEPHGLAIDRNGFVWVTLRGLPDLVERRGSNGSLIEDFPTLGSGADPEGISIREFEGESEAWVAADLPYRLVAGGVPDPIDAPGTPDPTGIVIDGDGNVWITDATGTASRYDANETLIDSVIIGTGPGFTGDASGMIQANLLDPLGDFDGDLFQNRFELDEGTNPFDELDNPGTVPLVLDLTCFVSGQDVTLNWTNPITYTAIEVSRDGMVIMTLAGTDTTSLDPMVTVSNQPYLYEVVGILGGAPSDPTVCEAIVGQGGVEAEHPIGLEVGDLATNLFDLTTNPAALPGDPRYYATDSANGKIYALDELFFVVGIIDSPFQDLVPSTGIAFNPDGDMGAGSLFVGSGGDDTTPSQIAETTLGGLVLDPPFGAGIFQPVGSLGPLTGPIGGLTFGNGSIVGVGPIGCELFGLFVSLAGPIEIEFIHPNPGPGLSGVQFVEASPDFAEFDLLLSGFDPATGEFSVDFAEVTSSAGVGSAAVLSSIPLTSLEDTENTFGGFTFDEGTISIVGTTTSTVYEVSGGSPFIRGDSDLNGTVNIGDALVILNFLFSQGPDNNCLLAYDVDDNETAGIGDAIVLLTYLFAGGPPPGPPFPDLGFDPTPSLLTCF